MDIIDDLIRNKKKNISLIFLPKETSFIRSLPIAGSLGGSPLPDNLPPCVFIGAARGEN